MERRRGRSPPASSFHGDRGASERPRSPGEDHSPLEQDDRRLQIVTPLADCDYYDYVTESHDQPTLSESHGPDRVSIAASENQLDFHHEGSVQFNTSAMSEVGRDEADSAPEDIELEPPAPPKFISLTSESTPQNPQSIIRGLTVTLPPAPQIDLAGLGSHPDLGKHSPHEPEEAKFQLDEYEPATLAPPCLPFGDSGYDEPIVEGSHEPDSETNKNHDHSDPSVLSPEFAEDDPKVNLQEHHTITDESAAIASLLDHSNYETHAP